MKKRNTYSITTKIRHIYHRRISPRPVIRERESARLEGLAVDGQRGVGPDRDLGRELLQLDVVVVAEGGQLLDDVGHGVGVAF